MKFSEKLMKLRKSQGMSQEDLATKLNVTRQTISKWESDQTVPDMNKLVEISKLFSTSLDELTNNVEITSSGNSYKESSTEKNNKKIAIKVFVTGLIICVVLCGIGFIKQNIANKTNQERYNYAYTQSQSNVDAAKKRLEEIGEIGVPLESQISNLEKEIHTMENEKTKIFNEDRGFSDRYYAKDNEINEKEAELLKLRAQLNDLNIEADQIGNKNYTVYYSPVKPITYLIFYYIGAGVFALMSLIALIYFLATRKK